MKNALFSCLALFLLAFLVMPAQASAHGLELHEVSTSSYQQAGQPKASAKSQVYETAIVKASTENKAAKSSCNGNCCSSTACCSAILASANSSKPDMIRSTVQPMALSGLAPLGPLHPLFRPPRISV